MYRLALAGAFACLLGAQSSPIPVLTQLTPNRAQAGTPLSVPMDVSGSNFYTNSFVLFGNSLLPTTYVNGGLLRVVIPPNLLITPALVRVVVVNVFYNENQTTTNYQSNPMDFLVEASLRIDTLEPASAFANTPDSDLFINGIGFIGGSQVLWDGTPLQSFYVNSARILARIPASLKAVGQPYTANIQVRNPRTSTVPEQVSNPLPFRVLINLQITSLNPSTARAGGPQFTMDVAGSGYVLASRVMWGATELQTQFLSNSLLRATVPAALIANPGRLDISVVNPEGAISNLVPFSVTAPFRLISIDPNTRIAGTTAFLMKATGSGFVNGSRVLWNGNPIPNSFTNEFELEATVAANLIAGAGTAQVSVRLPDGTVSNALTFTITSIFSLTSLSRTQATEGDPGFILTALGSGFDPRAQLQFGTTRLAPGAQNSTQMLVDIPSSLLRAGSYAVMVVNGDGRQSNSIGFTVLPRPIQPPVLSSISPNAMLVGSGAFILTLNGSNFTKFSIVRWNTTDLGTNFLSDTQLTAAVPANLLATVGTANVMVVDDPRFSGTAPFTVRAPQPVTPDVTGLQIGAQSNITVTISAPAELDLSGAIELLFTPNAAGVPATYFDPDLKFASGGTRATFTIPRGSMQAVIPGGIQFGSVAGDVTVRVATLTGGGVNVLAAPVSRTITIPQAKPTIVAGSATLTSPAAGQLLLELVGSANSRVVTLIRVAFAATTGNTIDQGASIDVSEVATPFRDFFASQAGQAGGANFRVRIPFTVSQGDLNAVQTATVTVINALGNSDPVVAARR